MMEPLRGGEDDGTLGREAPIQGLGTHLAQMQVYEV